MSAAFDNSTGFGTAAAVAPRPALRLARTPDSDPQACAWPAEVDFIMSALEAGGHRRMPGERRACGQRSQMRTLVRLQLFSDSLDAAPWILYTRDATPRSMGFITRHRLPLGYGGIIELTGPDGQLLRIDCTLQRCRETVSGWFEGVLTFNREQFCFC